MHYPLGHLSSPGSSGTLGKLLTWGCYYTLYHLLSKRAGGVYSLDKIHSVSHTMLVCWTLAQVIIFIILFDTLALLILQILLGWWETAASLFLRKTARTHTHTYFFWHFFLDSAATFILTYSQQNFCYDRGSLPFQNYRPQPHSKWIGQYVPIPLHYTVHIIIIGSIMYWYDLRKCQWLYFING